MDISHVNNEHTPCPWVNEGQAVYAGDVAICFAEKDPFGRATKGIGRTEAEANAAFIARACNCHNAMLEALRMALKIIEAEKAACGIYRAHTGLIRATISAAEGRG